jgi:transaldolase
VHDRTGGVDGWVSLEVSPLLAHDTAATIEAARRLHARAERPNLFIKIPGTGGPPAIEEAIFAACRQRDASLRDHRPLPRRSSVASSRIDAAPADVASSRRCPPVGRDRRGAGAGSPRQLAGIAIARNLPAEVVLSARQRIYNRAAVQRLLWASTCTKDPAAPPLLYVRSLAAPFTVNTMPEGTLKALAGEGEIGPPLAADGGDCEVVLARFAEAGIDVNALAARLQEAGGRSFADSWNALMDAMEARDGGPAGAGRVAGARVGSGAGQDEALRGRRDR